MKGEGLRVQGVISRKEGERCRVEFEDPYRNMSKADECLDRLLRGSLANREAMQ